MFRLLNLILNMHIITYTYGLKTFNLFFYIYYLLRSINRLVCPTLYNITIIFTIMSRIFTLINGLFYKGILPIKNYFTKFNSDLRQLTSLLVKEFIKILRFLLDRILERYNLNNCLIRLLEGDIYFIILITSTLYVLGVLLHII